MPNNSTTINDITINYVYSGVNAFCCSRYKYYDKMTFCPKVTHWPLALIMSNSQSL